MANKPQDWPLGERQIKAKIYYDDNADLVAKLRWLADEVEAGNVSAISEHPPWFAPAFNCCGGSPP